jgi:peroxiredoxin
MRLFFALLLAAASVCAAGDLSGRRAPGFSLPDLKFNQHDLLDYRGKVLLIDIMQTNCPHCAEFSGILEQAQAKYGNRIAVLSIVNPPDNQSTVARFASAHKITTPILFDCGQVAASYLKVTPQKPSFSVPHLFIVDPQGMIREDYGYSVLTKEIFEGRQLFTVLDRMLGGAPSPAQPGSPGKK